MPLTAIAIKNARPRDKAYKLHDERALYLLVTPQGGKYWRMNYRYLGKVKTLSFGVWPEVSLADARDKRDKARGQIKEGFDPNAQKKLARVRAEIDAAITFKSVAEEWLVKIEREGRAPVTLDKVRWLLDMAYPLIGERPLNKIEVQEVLAVLRVLEATGRYESARRMRSVISRIFRYGVATGRAQRDVAADLRGAIIVPKTRHYTAITTPKNAAEIMRAIELCSGHAITRFALRMTPHVFVRPGELRLILAVFMLLSWSQIRQVRKQLAADVLSRSCTSLTIGSPPNSMSGTVCAGSGSCRYARAFPRRALSEQYRKKWRRQSGPLASASGSAWCRTLRHVRRPAQRLNSSDARCDNSQGDSAANTAQRHDLRNYCRGQFAAIRR